MYTDILNNTSNQQWIVYPHTDNSVIRNFSNEFVLDVSKMMSIYSSEFKSEIEPKTCLWKLSAGRGEPKK